MNQDILFSTSDFVFSLRVGSILRGEDRVLLQCAAGEYAAIGGHVAGMEVAAETLRREFREELHTEIIVDDLSCVGEIFFEFRGRKWHQICFYYNVHLAGPTSLPDAGTFHGFDSTGKERLDLDYCWVPRSELEKGIPLYPRELAPNLLGSPSEITHFLSNQIKEAP